MKSPISTSIQGSSQIHSNTTMTKRNATTHDWFQHVSTTCDQETPKVSSRALKMGSAFGHTLSSPTNGHSPWIVGFAVMSCWMFPSTTTSNCKLRTSSALIDSVWFSWYSPPSNAGFFNFIVCSTLPCTWKLAQTDYLGKRRTDCLHFYRLGSPSPAKKYTPPRYMYAKVWN